MPKNIYNMSTHPDQSECTKVFVINFLGLISFCYILTAIILYCITFVGVSAMIFNSIAVIVRPSEGHSESVNSQTLHSMKMGSPSHYMYTLTKFILHIMITTNNNYDARLTMCTVSSTLINQL